MSSVRYELNFYSQFILFIPVENFKINLYSVTCFFDSKLYRHSGLWPRKTLFHLGPIQARLVVVLVALWPGFPTVFTLCPVSVIPAMLHTYVNTILSEAQEGETWEPSNKALLFRISQNIEQKNTCAMLIQANLLLVLLFSIHILLYISELSYLKFYTGSRKVSSYIELKVNIIHNNQ